MFGYYLICMCQIDFYFSSTKCLHFAVCEKCYLSQILYSRISNLQRFFSSFGGFLMKICIPLTNSCGDCLLYFTDEFTVVLEGAVETNKKFLLKHLTMDFYRRKRKLLIPNNYLNKRKSAKSCCYFLVAFREINQRVIKLVDLINVRPCT